jgi:hypothetical protein
MTNLQLILNSATCILLLLATIVLIKAAFNLKSLSWHFVWVVFLLTTLNKFFDFDNIIGNWFLHDGIRYINLSMEYAPWLKLYKQPGFIIDMVFVVLGLIVILLLNKRLREERVSYTYFIAGINAFIVVLLLGFYLSVSESMPSTAYLVQVTKDIFEVLGSGCFLVSFLSFKP